MKLAKIEYTPSKERHSALLDFQFLENVDFEWSANLHLKILTFIRAIKGFREDLKAIKERDGDSEARASATSRALDWRVSFKGETNLALILSQLNNMLFGTGEYKDLK